MKCSDDSIDLFRDSNSEYFHSITKSILFPLPYSVPSLPLPMISFPVPHPSHNHHSYSRSSIRFLIFDLSFSVDSPSSSISLQFPFPIVAYLSVDVTRRDLYEKKRRNEWIQCVSSRSNENNEKSRRHQKYSPMDIGCCLRGRKWANVE